MSGADQSRSSGGEIVDRNGTVIAANPDGLHGVRDPANQVHEPEKVIRELAWDT